MKVLLINAGIDNKEGEPIIEGNRTRPLFPMLALPYLAAYTPPHIDVQIYDEAHGLLEHIIDADLVGISGMTMHARRMYQLADEYRQLGMPVVLGGIHVTYMNQEASEHADAVVQGEAEQLWPLLLEDFQKGELKKCYHAAIAPDLHNVPHPRLDLVAGIAYRPPNGFLNSVMSTRGCPHNCNFCCVTKMFGRKLRLRPIDQVIEEILTLPQKTPVFFNDDNLIGNTKYAKELFRALLPYRKRWGSQMSLKIAEDDELLKLAARSGCASVFLGIESMNRNNIVAINKKSVNNVDHYMDAVRKIHDVGIEIIGSFIVGLDDDDDGVFEDIYDFVDKSKIEVPLVGILTPFPGTDIYYQFEKQGRIIDTNWNKYNLAHTVFRPNKMTPEHLDIKYNELIKHLNRLRFRNDIIRFSIS
ncbi:radical SAM protein [candidate division KSB1 bacterium]|nr:B12-binding domain-containing radical SAM protein [candidate division KSB1 bacterium]RQW01832.1 MAG: radical SAM protein [candidate division KSB1 bacterium]